MSTLPLGQRPPVEGLRVTGEAARETPPEVIELSFDIHGMGSTAAFALQDCAIRMMEIGQALTTMGIPQSDLQAGAMIVRSSPVQGPAPSLFGGFQPLLNSGLGSFGSIVPFTSALPQNRQTCGYDVSSLVKVSVRDIARLAEVVDVVMGSGGNVLASFRFRLHDEQALRRTLLEEAVREARDKAEILAAAVEKSVGRPTSIEEDFKVYQPHPVYGDGYTQNLSVIPTFPASMTRYPFMGGQLTFRASVSVTYHLQ